MNISKNLERSAFYFPGNTAIIEQGMEISYAELNARANRIAAALLKLGVSAGDLIALCAPNSGNWVAFYFGVLKTGAVAVTLSSLLRRKELSLLLCHCRPKVLFGFDDILGEAKVEGVRLKNVKTGELTEHKCDGFFLAIGHIPNTKLVEGQLELDEKGYIITKPDSSATSILGVFAAGDVQDAKYRQAVTAAASGCMAAIEAEKFLEAEEG